MARRGWGVIVPIYRLFKDQAFAPQHCEAMAAAFEAVLQKLDLKDRDDPLCQIIAKKIIELGQQGVRNPKLLRQFAIRDLGLDGSG
jgi:hypothetical protein